MKLCLDCGALSSYELHHRGPCCCGSYNGTHDFVEVTVHAVHDDVCRDVTEDTTWHAWSWGRQWHGYCLSVYITLKPDDVGWSVNQDGAHIDGGSVGSLPLAFLAAEDCAEKHERESQ